MSASSSHVPISTRRVQSLHELNSAPSSPRGLKHRSSHAAIHMLSKRDKMPSETMLTRLIPISKEEKLDFDTNLIPSICEAVQTILFSGREKQDDFHIYDSNNYHVVFSIKKIQGFIFKLFNGHKCSPEQRFENHRFAFRMIREHHFVHLAVPNAAMLYLPVVNKVHTIIIEEELPVDHGMHVQQLQYRKAGDALNPALKELTKFICLTQLRDVKWQNIPIIKSQSDAEDTHIGLVDLEDMTCAVQGLLGCRWAGIAGLVKCVSAEQGPMIIKTAKKYLDWGEELDREAEHALSERKRSLELEQKIDAFYHETGIVQGDEEIPSHPSDSDQVKTILKTLNTQIQHRNKVLSTAPIPMRRKANYYHYLNKEISEDQFSSILKLLVEKKRIYSFSKDDSGGFHIQA